MAERLALHLITKTNSEQRDACVAHAASALDGCLIAACLIRLHAIGHHKHNFGGALARVAALQLREPRAHARADISEAARLVLRDRRDERRTIG